MQTFKALSALLTYPTAELAAATDEIRAVLEDEALVDRPARAALEPLLASLARDDLYEAQARYVGLFDRSRSLSLHLFEHVHGEGRDRGQAMVDLASAYAARGFEVTASELPDFLPLFLEFLSLLPRAEAAAMLGEARHVVAALAERLEKRASPYAAVLAAIVLLAAPCAAEPDAIATTDIDPGDLAALDAEWEEAAVSFGPGDAMAACTANRFETRLRAARRAAANR